MGVEIAFLIFIVDLAIGAVAGILFVARERRPPS
jgi:hypothetical protein